MEPYVQAKVKALGLKKEAEKDLIYAVINSLGGSVKGDFASVSSIGTNMATSMHRAIKEKDKQGVEDALDNAVNSAVMDQWEKLKFNETAGAVLGKLGAGGKIAGLIAGGDYRGALEEVGSIMQDAHPAVEYTTKGIKYVSASINLSFTNWKANKIEELYQIYKHGGSGDLWHNEVLPRDRNSFLNYLNYASGLSEAKGVKRFYDMDKVAEVCKKFDWPYTYYDQLPEKYRNIFNKRAEDSLMEYFEIRLQQESEAQRIKEAERVCIEEMLKSPNGALVSKDYCRLFGENSEEEINVTNRLEKIVMIRNFISQYVDEKELERCRKADSYNYGYLINLWLEIYTKNPKGKSLDMFLAELKRLELIKDRFRQKATECQLKDFNGLWGNGKINFLIKIYSDHLYFNSHPQDEKHVWNIKKYKFNDKNGVLSFKIEDQTIAFKMLDRDTVKIKPTPPYGENIFHHTTLEDEKKPDVQTNPGVCGSIDLSKKMRDPEWEARRRRYAEELRDKSGRKQKFSWEK